MMITKKFVLVFDRDRSDIFDINELNVVLLISNDPINRNESKNSMQKLDEHFDGTTMIFVRLLDGNKSKSSL